MKGSDERSPAPRDDDLHPVARRQESHLVRPGRSGRTFQRVGEAPLGGDGQALAHLDRGRRVAHPITMTLFTVSLVRQRSEDPCRAATPMQAARMRPPRDPRSEARCPASSGRSARS